MVRKLAVILMRLMGDFVTIETDMSDLGRRNKCKDSIDHTESGTKDRNNGELLSCNHGSHACFNRSFDLDLL